jgi:hypothetical protein
VRVLSSGGVENSPFWERGSVGLAPRFFRHGEFFLLLGEGGSVGLTSTTSPGKKDSSGLAGVRDAGEDDVSIAEAFFGGVDSFPFFLRASRSLGSKFAEDEEGTGKEERGARRDGGAGARRVPERLFASFVEKVEGSRRGSDPATNTSISVAGEKGGEETGAGHHSQPVARCARYIGLWLMGKPPRRSSVAFQR